MSLILLAQGRLVVGVDDAASALPACLDYFAIFDEYRDTQAPVVEGAHAGVGLGKRKLCSICYTWLQAANEGRYAALSVGSCC